jgi:hypothetical protein
LILHVEQVLGCRGVMLGPAHPLRIGSEQRIRPTFRGSILDADTPSLECTPPDGHGSGRQIDHPPGVFLFALDRAPVSERRMEPLAVVDLIDEARHSTGR